MKRFNISKEQLKEIVNSSIQKILSESENLKEITFDNHNISVLKFDMSNQDDAAYIKANKDLIWNILQIAYEKLGGFKGIVAVSVYNSYLSSNKCVGTACVKDERHNASVKLLEMILTYHIEHWEEWVWIEASGRVEEMCRQLGGFNVPSQYVGIYLEHLNYTIVDDYHYSRKVKGSEVVKSIFGFNSRETFEELKKQLNQEIMDYISKLDYNPNIDENVEKREQVWNDHIKNFNELDKNLRIINYFIYLKDDELMNEFPQESLLILQKSIQYILKCIKLNNCGKYNKVKLGQYIQEGKRILQTSSILKPFNLPISVKE